MANPQKDQRLESKGADSDAPRSMRANRKVSAIIACYRDGPACPIMYERLSKIFDRIGVEYEIIFVNDASPDNAKEVLAEIARSDHRVVVVNHSRNFGSQSAFTSGMRIATGDAVVLLDGDLQDPPEIIEQFVAKWEQGFDVVYGIRTKRQATVFLRSGYKLFYRMFRAASYVPMPLDAGDFSLLDRRVVDALNSLPENNRFLRGLRAWVGFRQTGVTYTRPERMFGRTTNSFLRNLGWARKGIVSFSYAPLELITVLAVATIIGSALAAIAGNSGSPGQPPSGPIRPDYGDPHRPLPRWGPTGMPKYHRVLPRAHLRRGKAPPGVHRRKHS